MFSANVLEMFKYLVNNDIEVSFHKRDDGVVYADLHSHAKSHLHVYEKDGKVVFTMRYGMEEIINSNESVNALIYQAASCYAYRCICGRGFGSNAWDAVCEQQDITVSYGSM